MEYTIHRNNEDEFLIEIQKDSFSTKIVFDFEPDENFYGLAICCNYHKNGHPIGFLKDNGLIVSGIEGKKFRPSFEVGDSVIQAGPTLIENFIQQKRYKEEEFSTGEIVPGLHLSIGQKKFGNYVVLLTRKAALNVITEKLEKMSCQNAIKLPGLKKIGFYFRSKHQIVKEGLFPMPVALIFCPRIEKNTNLLS
jgi:hypothetical protein